MATANSGRLKAVAQRVADALPADAVDEVVLTGSVSRGSADELSDVEMLVVTREPLELEDCFGLARAAGLERLGTWGVQAGPARRVSGGREGVPIELIWWPRAHADAQIDLLLAGAMQATADALVHGVPLRTSGLLAEWQERLRSYPPDLAASQIEDAALPWGGLRPPGC
jgi:predicted nucleotidyltransferase